MIARKPAMLVLALLVLQFLGPLLHAHFSGPMAPTQTGMHLHAEGIPEVDGTANLAISKPLLGHDQLIKTVTLQQALNDLDDHSIADWSVLLPVLLLLLPLLKQSQAVLAVSRLILPKTHPYPDPHAPRAPPLA